MLVNRSDAPSMPLGVVAIVVLAVQVLVFGGLALAFYLESKLLKRWAGDLDYWHKVIAMGVMLLTVIGLTTLFVPYFIGALVRAAVEHYDVSYVGTLVHINEISVHPFSGNIWMTKVILDNPANLGPDPPYNWTSSYLLKVDSIHTQLSIPKLIFSFGRTILLRPLVVSGAHVMIETQPTGDSNANLVLNFYQSQPAAGRTYHVQEISVTDLKVKTDQLLGGDQWTVVPNIHFDDSAHISMSSLVEMVLQTVLNNAIRFALR